MVRKGLREKSREGATTVAAARRDAERFTWPVRLRSGQAAEAPLFHVADGIRRAP
jgi:hypothetical protein